MEPARRLLLSDYDGAIESPLPSPPPSSAAPFRPGVAVVVGILTSVFSITFLLLLYAKHCKRSAAESSGHYGAGSGGGGFGSSGAGAAGDRRNSGVDRAVVESLPVFRYGALRGQKEGLECAVCLGRFEPTEALRLLPKCRHGFHVECVDTWLDAHSTCPLCRCRVDPEDVLLLPEPPKPSTTGPPDPPETKAAAAAKEAPPAAPAPSPAPAGRRISGRHSTGSVRAPGRVGPGSRRSVDAGVAVGCFDGAKVRKDRVLLVEPAAVVAEPDPEAFDRRFGHRILVSTAGGCEGETAPAAQQRWSDLRLSDLMFVRSEFLVTDAGRYSCSAAVVNSGNNARSAIGVRSLSELAGVCRLPPIRAGSHEGEEPRAAAGARRWPGSSWWGATRGPPAPGRNGPSAA
ncbi:RING-H2 finger protein ATL43 [Dichanthelium oligosanthes]|uniref:RING-type E3 ubiquitin transferase n=1 Tax=Dichanthelium oligosanthes TaxID=888268 RepID=A0A1E5UYV0_9POAL|nr:RING-H2 finger protein ATL43 [Dichanthelium oligosanthes]